jgi:hypothetical protein
MPKPAFGDYNVKGAVSTFCTFMVYHAFFRATASKFETWLQLPVAKRSAAHLNVAVVSPRSRTAIRPNLHGRPWRKA